MRGKGEREMDILTTVVVLIPSILSLCISGIYAYIALKKAKEPPKDEIWETATKILCNSNSMKEADDFAFLYEELKFFRDRGCTMDGITTLSYAVREKHRQAEQKQSGEN